MDIKCFLQCGSGALYTGIPPCFEKLPCANGTNPPELNFFKGHHYFSESIPFPHQMHCMEHSVFIILCIKANWDGASQQYLKTFEIAWQ